MDGTPIVTSADNIMTENGVIHAISRVLMPNWGNIANPNFSEHFLFMTTFDNIFS